VIAACIPVRTLLLPKYFTKEELIYIDGDDDEVEALVKGQDDSELVHGGNSKLRLPNQLIEHQTRRTSHLDKVKNHPWILRKHTAYRFLVTYSTQSQLGDLEGVTLLWDGLRALELQVDYCWQQCDERTHFALFVIRQREGEAPAVDMAAVQDYLLGFMEKKEGRIVFLPSLVGIQDTRRSSMGTPI